MSLGNHNTTNMPVSTQVTQIVSISAALLAAGANLTISIFDIPEMRSQPADRSLPMIRWLFSRGSHIFPQAAAISCAGFTYLAYDALPRSSRSILQLLKTSNGMKVNGYITAAVLAISIAPFTSQIMIPNNFALIKKNEELGGARSAEAAEALRQSGYKPGQRSAEDSVNSKGEGTELTDLSDPATKTALKSSQAQDQEVQGMLTKFQRQNIVRGLLMGAGGIVGLATALA